MFPSPTNGPGGGSNIQCQECGFMHPPVQGGGSCPLVQKKDVQGNVIDVNPTLTSMKNILIANMQTKGIKDHQKFYRFIIVNLTKQIEQYKEGDN